MVCNTVAGKLGGSANRVFNSAVGRGSFCSHRRLLCDSDELNLSHLTIPICTTSADAEQLSPIMPSVGEHLKDANPYWPDRTTQRHSSAIICEVILFKRKFV